MHILSFKDSIRPGRRRLRAHENCIPNTLGARIEVHSPQCLHRCFCSCDIEEEKTKKTLDCKSYLQKTERLLKNGGRFLRKKMKALSKIAMFLFSERANTSSHWMELAVTLKTVMLQNISSLRCHE